MFNLKTIFLTLILLLLTACGEGDTESEASISLGKIIHYAQKQETAPTLQDYQLAGIVGVTPQNITKINQLIKESSPNSVDSISEVQAIVNSQYTPPHSDNPDANDEKHTYTGVVINEVLASNTQTNMDPDFFTFSDWVELYNDSEEYLDISGYHLSDNNDKLKKWEIPQDTQLAPKQYLLIWADHKDVKKKALHANFRLSLQKESVLLSNEEGTLIDAVNYNKQDRDISFSSQNTHIVYMTPSPKAKNHPTHQENRRLKAPLFSLANSFYPYSQTLTLEQEEGAKIYYTTDGKKPTKNATLYTKPIPINKNMVIKAIALNDSIFDSLIETRSYFIGEESQTPILSVSIDPFYLYDDQFGIYVKGSNGKMVQGCIKGAPISANFNQHWKRPAHLDYYDKNKNGQFSFDFDLSISGECSRFNNKKSFSFNLESKYGTKSLTHKLFTHKKEITLKSFKLKAGNEGYQIGDSLAANLVSSNKLNIDYQDFQTVRMFLNGEYWGIYHLMEKKGADYLISNHPDIQKSKLDIIKNGGLHPEDVKEGTLDDYKKLSKYAAEENYAEVSSRIDIDNFIDFISLMIYSGNEDWSFSNSRAWKERKGGKKWRWVLDDLDEGFQEYVIQNDTFSGTGENATPIGITNSSHELADIFNTLYQNPRFKSRFKTRFKSLLQGAFSPTNVNQQIKTIFDAQEREVSKEPEKWYHSPFLRDYRDYQNQIKEFANQRASVVQNQLDSF